MIFYLKIKNLNYLQHEYCYDMCFLLENNLVVKHSLARHAIECSAFALIAHYGAFYFLFGLKSTCNSFECCRQSRLGLRLWNPITKLVMSLRSRKERHYRQIHPAGLFTTYYHHSITWVSHNQLKRAWVLLTWVLLQKFLIEIYMFVIKPRQ